MTQKQIDHDSLALIRGLVQWAAAVLTLVEKDHRDSAAWKTEAEQLRTAIDQCIEQFGLEDKPGKTRHVEYYRLWGGDSGTWDTDFIDIPADTPDDKVDEAVRKAAEKIKWRDEAPVIVGCYCDSDAESPDEEGTDPWLAAPACRHRYPAQCPQCQADLDTAGSVTIQFRVRADLPEQEVVTCLDHEGWLVDVDYILLHGYHSGTSCRACGASLDEHEIVDDGNAASTAQICAECTSDVQDNGQPPIYCSACGRQVVTGALCHGVGSTQCTCGAHLTIVETDDQTQEWSVTVSRLMPDSEATEISDDDS